jgi:predicted phosphodiesterase
MNDKTIQQQNFNSTILSRITKTIWSVFISFQSFLTESTFAAIQLLSSERKKIENLYEIDNFSLEYTELTTDHERVRCYCVSDLHADHAKSKLWLNEKCRRDLLFDNCFNILIIAGDISSELSCLEFVFKYAATVYDAVCYVPGNHEAWSRPYEKTTDSIDKLGRVLDIAKQCGIFVGPLRIQTPKSGLCLFPLYSWYHSGFEKEPPQESLVADKSPFKHIPFDSRWADFMCIKWPEDLVKNYHFKCLGMDCRGLAECFARLNEPFLTPKEMISTSESLVTPSRSLSNEAFSIFVDEDDDVDAMICEDNSSELKEFDDLDEAFRNHRFTPPREVDFFPGALCNEPRVSRERTYSNIPKTIHGSGLIEENDTVISFSHFLPRPECCPEKKFLFEADLPKVIGSNPLGEQVSRLKPHLHIFGHTHIPIDIVIEGITYVQWSLGGFR